MIPVPVSDGPTPAPTWEVPTVTGVLVPTRRETDIIVGLIAPLIRIGAAAADRGSAYVPRPLDDPHGFAPGADADRILVLGAGLAVGWGVSSHAVALPGALARALSAETGRGCTVDLIAAPGLDVASASDALQRDTLARYDGVVLVFGVNEALHVTPSKRWREDLELLLGILVRHTPRETPCIVMGIPPIRSMPLFDSLTGTLADFSARRLNAITMSVCCASPQTTFVPLSTLLVPSDDRYRTREQYSHLAGIIAKSLFPKLVGPRPERREKYVLTPEREARRQRSVNNLALALAQGDPDLDRLVLLAKKMYGTQTALITVLDEDRQWHLATAGQELSGIPRELAICDSTIQTANGLVIRDTLDDDRFRDSPLATAGPKIRFYAGFPIETPEGERIGAICVIDSSPRRRHDDLVDTGFLQQLALLAQGELWRYRAHRFDDPRSDPEETTLTASLRPSAVSPAPNRNTAGAPARRLRVPWPARPAKPADGGRM